MLFSYLQRAQLLLNDASMAKFNRFDLTTYINLARGQLAGEAECLRNYATLALSANVQSYSFSSISLSGSGISGVFNVRQALIQVNDGLTWIRPRSFEWFTFFRLNNSAPVPAQPNEWSQFGQGVTGSIFVSPTPDASYTLNLDTSCYPTNLAADTDVESIPYPWTDAVPFFAAYYALMSAGKDDEADKMFERYQMWVDRARMMSNATVLPSIYPQSGDPVRANRLGITTKGGQ